MGGEVSVTVSFVDDGGHHKGGVGLGLGTNVSGERAWIIKQIY